MITAAPMKKNTTRGISTQAKGASDRLPKLLSSSDEDMLWVSVGCRVYLRLRLTGMPM